MKKETQVQFLSVSTKWILNVLESLLPHISHRPDVSVHYHSAMDALREALSTIEPSSLPDDGPDPEEEDYDARGFMTNVEDKPCVRVPGAELLKPGQQVLVMGRAGVRKITRVGRIVSRYPDENGRMISVYESEHRASYG